NCKNEMNGFGRLGLLAGIFCLNYLNRSPLLVVESAHARHRPSKLGVALTQLQISRSLRQNLLNNQPQYDSSNL
ncbi:MAG: hypothetical protein IJT30_08550, partial [Muribaculaceae bacterium]|nr:hypothetical protein [Muribaculaceae bacterium]